MEYTQIIFEDISSEKKDLLIALLGNEGFEGFEEEDNNLKAYISSGNFNENTFNSVIEIVDVKYSKSIIKEINWNEKWESDFEPIRVYDPSNTNPVAYLRAHFHRPDNSFLHDIVVTPKMSFGTGHHATTYLMTSHMSNIDFKNKSVIDFGTGTGVLAILAEKMGASDVLAVDCDDWSIENAKENLEVNRCFKVKVIKDVTIPENAKADIILANINLNVIIANLSVIKESAKSGALILFSGVLEHDKAQILNEIDKSGLHTTQVFPRENWLAISVVNK